MGGGSAGEAGENYASVGVYGERSRGNSMPVEGVYGEWSRGTYMPV